MPEKDKSAQMKSAYERALERLDEEGIERPRDQALSTETRDRIAEVRDKARAKLAEIEILHRDKMRHLADPRKREEEEANYQRERRRVEHQRDRELSKIRQEA